MKFDLKQLAKAAFGAFCVLTTIIAAAEDYPTKPVRVLVGFPAGSGTDVFARIIAGALSAKFKQPFVVENRSGANGVLAATALASSKPDGYTLIATNSSSMTVTPLLHKEPQYDTLRDFTGVGQVIMGHYVVTINPANPRTSSVATLNDLMALAKAKPGMLIYGVANTGSFAHISTELLSIRAGIKMTHVAYRATTEAQTGLLRGDLDLHLDVPSCLGQVKAGKLKALAVTMPVRWAELPDVPTIGEFYSGFDASFWWGVLTRAGTPEHIVDLLNREIVAATNRPDIRKQLEGLGVIMTSSPQAFAAKLKAEIAQNSEVIQRANIKVE